MILSPRIASTVCTVVAAALLAAAAGGCASSPRFTTHPVLPRNAASPATSHTDRPALLANDTTHTLLMTQGLASYYADDFNGKMTADGEIYNMYDLTAAHRSLPFGTTLRVTNLDYMKTVVVRINDRGPFKMERIIDLSLGAAAQLQMMEVGVARVQLDVIEWGDNLYKK